MDPNEAYGDAAASGAPARGAALRGSGQPSLIWGGIVDIGGESHAEELILLGHGRPAGANGEVDADLAGLTTALAIADTIRVEYTRPD
jgi:hypothetical protein